MTTIECLAGIVIPIVNTSLRPTPLGGQPQSLNLSKMAGLIKDRRPISLRNIDLGGRLDSETRWYLTVFTEMCGHDKTLTTAECAAHLSTRLRIAHKMCDEAGLRLVDVIKDYAQRNRMMRIRR